MALVNLTRTEFEAAVTAAVAAPSVLNMQPWRFHAHDNSIDVFVDRTRRVPTVDPDDRELCISCGAAVFNLRTALEAAGYLLDVVVCPNDQTDLLATVTAIRSKKAGAATKQLADAIARRRSSRFPFYDTTVAETTRASLVAAAAAEGALLHFPADWAYADLVKLLQEADRLLDFDPAARAELARWVGVVADEGIPDAALGPRPRDPSSTMRTFAPVPGPPREVADFEKEPVLAVLSTHGDTIEDWVDAGQALEHVLLRATTEGLVCSLNSGPMEASSLRWLARDPAGPLAIPQMVLRIGHGPQGPATPRRPLQEVLFMDSAAQNAAKNHG